jgi:hypothetical protein
MRALRPSLAGTVILALLGGLGGVVLGQDEVPLTATRITGTVVDKDWDDSEGEYTTDEHGVDQLRGLLVHETWEWSDERLPAAKTGVWNNNGYWIGEGDGVLAWTGTNRLDGPDGSWIGTATGMYEPGTGSSFGLDVYVGEGAYEGLTLILQCGDRTCEGYILEGELPPMPEPVEPPTE